jgi:transcriptional regulator with XRE-family HTH domain
MPVQKPAEVETVQKSLGHCIRELRNQEGWSQERFAEICGLHRTYMGHVERGEKNISLSTVLRVANALGIRVSDLFGRAENHNGKAAKAASPAKRNSDRSGLPGLIERVIEELRLERKALRDAVRTMNRFAVRP